MKKGLALILVLCLALSIAVSASAAEPGKVNRHGWLVPEETLEISIAYGQQVTKEFKEDTALLLDYIFQEFNVKITPQYWDTDYGERQSLMMASGDYPDVMARLTVPQAMNWIGANKAQDLLPLIDQYAPGIRDNMGKYFKRYTDRQGKMHMMPCEWGELPITLSAPSIRYDWWEELGKPDLGTSDKFYDVIRQMADAHPQGVDGNKTYALGMSTEAYFLRVYQGMWGLKKNWKIDADNNLTYWSQTDEGLALAKWLNQIYIDGYLDPDSFSQSETDLEAKFTNERYSGHVGSWWKVGSWGFERWNKASDWVDAKRFAHVNVVGEGVEQATYTPLATLGYTRTVITDKARNVEGIMKWMEFEGSPEGMHLIGLGVPNLPESYWTIDEEGNWAFVQQYIDEIANNDYFDYEPHNKLGAMYLQICLPHMSLDGTFCPWWDQNFRDLDRWKKMMNSNMEPTFWDSAYLDGITIDPEDTLAIINQQCIDLAASGFAEAVTAPSQEECEAKFREMQDKISRVGVDKLNEYYTQQYKANVENWD